MRLFLFLIILLLVPGRICAQKVLALENYDRFKRIILYPGDNIRFKTFDSGSTYKGVIELVTDSTLVILKSVKVKGAKGTTRQEFRDWVPISEIKTIYSNKNDYWRYFKNMYSVMAMAGGAMLLAGTAVNTLTSSAKPDESSVIIASAILLSGLAVRYIGRDKYKIGKRWQLRAMEPVVEADGFRLPVN